MMQSNMSCVIVHLRLHLPLLTPVENQVIGYDVLRHKLFQWEKGCRLLHTAQ